MNVHTTILLELNVLSVSTAREGETSVSTSATCQVHASQITGIIARSIPSCKGIEETSVFGSSGETSLPIDRLDDGSIG